MVKLIFSMNTIKYEFGEFLAFKHWFDWLSNHVRCDHPMHILHQRGMLCRKTMKFIEQGSIDKLRHIFVEEQNVHFTFCEKRPTLFYKIFAVSCFNEKWFIQCCCAATGRIFYTSYKYRIGPIAAGRLISAGPPNGSRAAPVDTVRNLLYIFTKIGKNNRAVPGRYPGGPF